MGPLLSLEFMAGASIFAVFIYIIGAIGGVTLLAAETGWRHGKGAAKRGKAWAKAQLAKRQGRAVDVTAAEV